MVGGGHESLSGLPLAGGIEYLPSEFAHLFIFPKRILETHGINVPLLLS